MLPQPALGAPRNLTSVNREVTRAENLNGHASLAQRIGEPLKHERLRPIHGVEPWGEPSWQDDREVQGTGTDHDRATAARSPSDRDAIDATRLDDDILEQAARGSENHGGLGSLPDSHERPRSSLLGLDEERLVEC